MERQELYGLVEQLATGFETLQDEYQKLFGRHQALERKLAKAREQYNELAKLYGAGAVATPPLSLSPSPDQRDRQTEVAQSVAEILERHSDETSKDSAHRLRAANKAAQSLRYGFSKSTNDAENEVKIWSGPSADRLDVASSMMPSISESPLEQDFTIEGLPSKLGCPFASMAKKKLSSHAASVLSRYNQTSAAASSGAMSSVSRINGKESWSRKDDRRSSFVDPIKAEICGLSDHDEESPLSERAMKDHLDRQEATEPGVCPIRFLDQHSPQEVATYFERHKHELPRSHEVCVKRYQSNEQQIRELDAKYGNLVSMIQGLGATHQPMLPQDPDANEANEAGDAEAKSAEKIGKWASSVSAQVGEGEDDVEYEEDRKPHFERPLRDIRVGESPSRPWGISVPAKYVELAGSAGSTQPAPAAKVSADNADIGPPVEERAEEPARCPFGFDKKEPAKPHVKAEAQSKPKATPAFMSANTKPEHPQQSLDRDLSEGHRRMVFNGPVFFGYSAEEAAKILRDSGMGASQ